MEGAEFTYSYHTLYSRVEGTFKCGGHIHMWELLMCGGDIHVWELLTCGLDIPV